MSGLETEVRKRRLEQAARDSAVLLFTLYENGQSEIVEPGYFIREEVKRKLGRSASNDDIQQATRMVDAYLERWAE